ncbi:MAG: flagellar protein FliS [Eubacteriales bacterium]
MMEDGFREYNARVVQASKCELVVISYEFILDLIQDAERALEQNNKELFEEKVKKTQKVLKTLINSLDFCYDISRNLMSLYIYTNQQLVYALFSYNDIYLKNAEKILDILLAGWMGVCDDEESNPLITNAQKLYAGLTYGKKSLNETILNDSESRGLKA